MKTDIEIAQEARLIPIREVAAAYGIAEDDLELYGNHSGGYSGRRRKEKKRTEKTGTEICYSEGKER